MKKKMWGQTVAIIEGWPQYRGGHQAGFDCINISHGGVALLISVNYISEKLENLSFSFDRVQI